MSSSATDSPVSRPKMTKLMEGGMSAAIVPAAAMQPAEKARS